MSVNTKGGTEGDRASRSDLNPHVVSHHCGIWPVPLPRPLFTLYLISGGLMSMHGVISLCCSSESGLTDPTCWPRRGVSLQGVTGRSTASRWYSWGKHEWRLYLKNKILFYMHWTWCLSLHEQSDLSPHIWKLFPTSGRPQAENAAHAHIKAAFRSFTPHTRTSSFLTSSLNAFFPRKMTLLSQRKTNSNLDSLPLPSRLHARHSRERIRKLSQLFFFFFFSIVQIYVGGNNFLDTHGGD